MFGEERRLRDALIPGHITFFRSDATATLVEENPNFGLSRAYIHGVNRGSLLIRFHGSGPVPRLIQNKNGYYKNCDYALFTRIGSKPTIFYIELKSTNFEEQKVAQQLRGGACIVDYLLGFSKRFLGIEPVEYQERYVLFHRSRRNSRMMMFPQPTRIPFTGSGRPNTKPNWALALPDPDRREYFVEDLIR